MNSRHAAWIRSPRPLAGILGCLVLACALAAAGAAAQSGGKPRLSVARVSSPPQSVRAGKTFPVDVVVRNRGRRGYSPSRSGRGFVRFELRGGNLAEPRRIGKVALRRIQAGGRRELGGRVRVPSSLAPSPGSPPAGPYRLIGCVRAQGIGGAHRCRRAKGALRVRAGSTSPPPPGTNFRPGARSLGDPLFPQIGNGGYDADHYAIDLRYTPSTNRFGPGTKATMSAVATQNLSQLSLDFQALDVSGVTVDGAPAQFRQVNATPQFSDNPAVTQPKKLIVTPASGIPSGRRFTVAVRYSGAPKAIVDADESVEGWVRACSTPATCDGSFVVNEPIGAQSWFPSNNYATDKASYETSITVPSSHVALGVGELTAKAVNDDGTTTWRWSEDDPTASYLTSASVGEFDFDDTGSFLETSTGKQLPIYEAIDSAALPTQKTTIKSRTAEIPAMTNFISERYGPYPFDSTGLVADWAPNVGYALENQTKPHFAGNQAGPSVGRSTLLHEIAHQWMGDSVSPATWLEIWFNEGWATFSEVYWGSRVNNGQTPEAFFASVYSTPADDPDWDTAPAKLDGDPKNLFAEFPVYERPAAMLEGYREIVGEDRFFAFAKALVDRYGYDVIDIEGFIATAKEFSGFEGAELQRLDEYFRQWLLREARPSLSPADFGP